MKLRRYRKMLVLIGLLTVAGIVLSSIVFEVKPMASENPQTMEERALFDESNFESEVSSEVSRKIPTSAMAAHMMSLIGAAPGQTQEKINENVNEQIALTEDEQTQETDTAEVVSSPLPAASMARLETPELAPFEPVSGLTPTVFEKRTELAAPITAQDTVLKTEDETIVADEEEDQDETVYEEAYTETWTDEDEEDTEEETPAVEETPEESSEEESEESSEEKEEPAALGSSEEDPNKEESSEESTEPEEESSEKPEESEEPSEPAESSEPAGEDEESSQESAETPSASSGTSWESDPGTTSRGVSTDASRVVDGYTELDYLAALCQCEAGPYYDGSLAVANCVLNRLYAGFESNIYDVIYAPYQFATSRIGGYLANGEVSSTCYQAAQDALSGVNNIGSYLFFNGVYWLDPATLERPYVVIGGNCFY